LGTSYCLSISPDNKYFATGGSDALIAIWDLKEMVCVQTYTGVEEQVRKLGFSWNSQYLASASEDSKIAIISVEDGNYY
jgi:THO complex subunit 3